MSAVAVTWLISFRAKKEMATQPHSQVLTNVCRLVLTSFGLYEDFNSQIDELPTVVVCIYVPANTVQPSTCFSQWVTNANLHRYRVCVSRTANETRVPCFLKGTVPLGLASPMRRLELTIPSTELGESERRAVKIDERGVTRPDSASFGLIVRCWTAAFRFSIHRFQTRLSS